MNTIFRRISAFFISAAITAGCIPCRITLAADVATYTSVYPDRVCDESIFDDLEDYEIGDMISRLSGKYTGRNWWDPGNNQNDFGIIDILDGTKVISYEGEHDYTSFSSPANKGIAEKLWVDVDIKLPENYCEYRFQIGDATHPDRIGLIFYKEGSKLEAIGVQNPAGGNATLMLSDNIPQNEWFTLSLLLDIPNEIFYVYVNGVRLGRDMNFNYKFTKQTCTSLSHPDGPCPEAAYTTLRFAHRGGAFDNTKIYLDNYRLSYARTILPVPTQEVTIDVGEDYILPSAISLALDNNTKRDFAMNLTPMGPALDTNVMGAYQYSALIEHYPETVDFWVYVKNRTIQGIEKVYEKAYLNDSGYHFPETVPAIMDDGSIKYVDVTWQSVPDVANTGTYVYYGTVDGYANGVELCLEVLAPSVLSVDDYYLGIKRGDSYTLPDELRVIFSNHKYGKAKVEWDNSAYNVDTESLGKHTFTGKVEGYNENIKLYITVYEGDEFLDYIETVLVEFYDNVLTKGRDRSEWFKEEYNEGYDPALGRDYDYKSSIDGRPYSPLPSMAINRNTNTHALWPAPSRDMPLAVPATQSPLWKGLQGMSAITGNDKYFYAVEEAHSYLINNKVDPDGHILRWGDHILQQFDHPQLEHQSESDSYSYMCHQLECDTPEVEMLFSGNAEAAERYIKALWAGHFNGREDGVMFDTMEFSRHATANNVWDIDTIDNVFKARYDFSEAKIHEVTDVFLTFINAAIDYVWTAVKLWEHTGDTDALHYARKLLWCYNEAAHPETGLIPFMYTDTAGGNAKPITNVFHPHYLIFVDKGHTQDSYNRVYDNPEAYGTTRETVDYSYTLHQGKCGGGNFYMPLICFRVADIIGGEMGEEIEQWGINAMMAFVNYTYDYKTGLGKGGFTDGTVLDDYKADHTAYFTVAGRTDWPLTISSDMTWLLIEGYERTGNEKIWECLRSICMSLSLGDIGTAPGINMNLEKYTQCDDSNVLITLSKLYEITDSKEYYNLAKRITNNIISKRYINGFFYKTSNGAYARISDPAPFCILYFLATARGQSKMIPEYLGESFDFQTAYIEEDGKITDRYGYSLLNETIVSEIYPSAVICDVNEIVLKVNEQKKVYAEVFPDNAIDTNLTWTTDNNEVCMVNNGLISAINPGTCIVTAEASNGVSKTIKVTVGTD